MKRCLATIAAIGSLAASTASWSKGDITKITLERVDTDAVIEITQPEVLDRFAIWSGPGVGGWNMATTVPKPDDAAFIVDWTQGVLAGAPDAPTYEVAMYVEGREPPCDKYAVLYRVDEAGAGYVYLPRWNEEFGSCNMSLIYRDVEGNWFRSSKKWDEAAERFGIRPVAAQSTASPPTECPIIPGNRVGNGELLAWSGGTIVFKPGGASEAGHFTCSEWSAALGAELRAAAERGEPDDGSRYYEHWLSALERLVTSKGLADAQTLATRKNEWQHAYRNTPHGQPVELQRRV